MGTGGFNLSTIEYIALQHSNYEEGNEWNFNIAAHA